MPAEIARADTGAQRPATRFVAHSRSSSVASALSNELFCSHNSSYPTELNYAGRNGQEPRYLVWSSYYLPGDRCRFMENYIETQNIAKFKARLKSEADPVLRATLTQLLAEEEAKHAARIKTRQA